jgi:glutamyl-tRNA synthetase
MEALEWLGIPPDETIGKNEIWSLSTKRKKTFIYYADQLINTGWIYVI